MNIGLLIAGGSGTRMNMEIPKQFLTVYEKPIIIYTLERFQKHPNIDAIAVVCKEGWEDILSSYAKQYNITKLKHIITGGSNGQESIFNGISELSRNYDEKDLVLIHDGIRPMVSEEIISSGIAVAKKNGNAITVIPSVEVIARSKDAESSNRTIPRDELFRTQTPQTFSLGKLLNMHNEAKEKNISDSTATVSLAIDLGNTVHFSSGSEKNVKITTADDLDIFKSLLSLEGNNK